MSKNVKRNKWSKKEDRKIGKMISEGMTYKVIGQNLNRTPAAIATRVHGLRKNGLVLAGKNGGRPLGAPKQEKPKYVKVAQKILKSSNDKLGFTDEVAQKILKSSNDKQLSSSLTMGRAVSAELNRLVIYAKMLETQNAALEKRLAEIEKIIRK